MSRGTLVLLRRSTLNLDVRTLPIDGLDMFLLTRIEGTPTIALAELVALTPSNTVEIVARVEQLVRLGVLEFEDDTPAPSSLDGAVLLTGDEAVTLRPPKTVDLDDAQTLRPPKARPRTVIQARSPLTIEIVQRPPRGGRLPNR
jgi:hypothetical protein